MHNPGPSLSNADVLTGTTATLGLDSKIAGLLCYFPIFPVNVVASALWLATEPKSNRALRFHAMQSLLLTGLVVVAFILLAIVGTVVSVVIAQVATGLASIFGLLMMLLYLALGLAALALYVMAMVKVYGGQPVNLPIVGSLAERFM